MRLVASIALIIAMSACSSGKSVSPPGPGATVLVTAALASGVDLYRAGTDHQANKVGSLQPPAFAPHALSITISAADNPVICVVWAERREDPQLPQGSCYRPVPTTQLRTFGGTPINGLPADVTAISISEDGRRLAWLDPQPTAGRPEKVDVVTGRFGPDGSVTETARVTPEGNRPSAQRPKAREVLWAGSTTLVVTAVNPDGSADEYITKPQSSPEGWLAGRSKNLGFVDPDLVWEDQITVSATDRTALLLELAPFAANGSPRSRLVSVDRTTSRVLEIVAVAEPGRQVTLATGGVRGVVFDTDVDGEDTDVKTYLRLPGEKSGRLLKGLPLGARIAAQP